MNAPIIFRWDGDAMVPVNRRFAKACDERFVVGAEYPLEAYEHRSSASHRHYFAAIYEAWSSLPEGMGDRFPNPEHLRKFALIRCGYRDERTIVAASKAEALRLAAFIRPMDDFAIVTTDGATVTVWTAKSQNLRSMDKATFYKSKEAVLCYLGSLLSVAASEIENAGKAA